VLGEPYGKVVHFSHRINEIFLSYILNHIICFVLLFKTFILSGLEVYRKNR
jgi:hypothetical protein